MPREKGQLPSLLRTHFADGKGRRQSPSASDHLGSCHLNHEPKFQTICRLKTFTLKLEGGRGDPGAQLSSLLTFEGLRSITCLSMTLFLTLPGKLHDDKYNFQQCVCLGRGNRDGPLKLLFLPKNGHFLPNPTSFLCVGFCEVFDWCSRGAFCDSTHNPTMILS